MIKRFIPLVPKLSTKSKREFRKDVQLHLPKRFDNELLGENVCVVIDFRLPSGDPLKEPDVDNLLKGALDVIKGSLLKDDRQVKEVHARITNDDKRNGFYLTIHPLQTA